MPGRGRGSSGLHQPRHSTVVGQLHDLLQEVHLAGVQGHQADSLTADMETCAEMTGSYTRLQRELGILQEKLNNVSVIISYW